jgi:hypothetical protein
MKKFYWGLVGILTIVVLPAVVSSETISMTTYLPPPVAVYDQMRLVPSISSSIFSTVNTCSEGSVMIDASKRLRICVQALSTDLIWGRGMNRSTTAIATGTGAIALGENTQAIGSYSFASGDSTISQGGTSWASGQNSTAQGSYSVTMSGNSTTTGSGSVSFGDTCDTGDDYAFCSGNSSSLGVSSTSMGSSSAIGDYSVGLGEADVSGASSTGMGSATTTGDYALAIGENAGSLGAAATAIGSGASSLAIYSSCVGANMTCSGLYATSIAGANTLKTITHEGSTSIGGYNYVLPPYGQSEGNYSTSFGADGMADAFAVGLSGLHAHAHIYGAVVIGPFNGSYWVGSTAPIKTGSHWVSVGAHLVAARTIVNPVGIGSQGRTVASHAVLIGHGIHNYAPGAVGIGRSTSSIPTDANGIGIGRTTDASLNSIAIGHAAKSTSPFAVGIGNSAQAQGDGSVAIGSNSIAIGDYSVAIGLSATTLAAKTGSVALVQYTQAGGTHSTAIGDTANAAGITSTSIGYKSKATNQNTTALGYDNSAGGIASTAFGYKTKAQGNTDTALGEETDAFGTSSLVMGYLSRSRSLASTAIGYDVQASKDLSVAWGREIDAKDDFTFAVALNDQNGTNINPANVMSIMGGNVGIGYAAPAYKLDVNGTVRGNNVAPSDARLKKDIKKISGALENVKQLSGVSFEWIDKNTGIQLGVIAQEIEKIFPDVVMTDPSGYKSVAYEKLAAVLIEALKDLKTKNKALKKRLKLLEKKLN